MPAGVHSLADEVAGSEPEVPDETAPLASHEPAPRRSLPLGLTLTPPGSSLAGVATKTGSLDLLAAGRGMEVVRGALADGERLNMVPAEDGLGALEVCVVTSGVLTAPDDLGAVRLPPGSAISADGLAQPVSFTADGDVTFLYITSRPQFQAISRDLHELRRLAVDIEVTDGYTADHCERLQRLSYATGKELGLDAGHLYNLDFGAYLHDVGKVRVPTEILTKPGKLTDEEWVVIKRHPSYGREMLEPTFMRTAGTIVEQHHERLDGSGYPYGLAGDDVLIESYIVAVADTYDAMTTDRPYRKGLPAQEAFDELERLQSVQFPRDVVRAFRSAVLRVEHIPSAEAGRRGSAAAV